MTLSAALAHDTTAFNNPQGGTSDGITSDPTISGFTDAGATLRFTDEDGQLLGSIAAPGSGAYSFTPSLADGRHTVTVVESQNGTDVASSNLGLTLDTTSPSLSLLLTSGTNTTANPNANQPLRTDPGTGTLFLNAAEFAQAFRVGGTVADTNLSTALGVVVTFTPQGGQATQKAVLLSTDGAGHFGYAFRVDAPGTANGANAALAAALTDGRYTVHASATDLAGNVVQTADQTLVVDTVAPPLAFTVPGGTVTQATQVVSGTAGSAQSGTVVTLSEGGSTVGTATVQSDGHWTTNVTLAGLGTHNITASDTDAAGNTATAQISFTVQSSGNTNTGGTTGGGNSGGGGTTSGGNINPGGTGDGTSIDNMSVPQAVNQGSFGNVEHSTASSTAGIYALYEALLGRAPDPLGLEGFAAALKAGAGLTDVASALINSQEHGPQAASTGAFVQSLFSNLLHRNADSAGLSFYTDELAHGVSQAQVAVQIATSAEGQANIKPAFDTGVFVPDAIDAAVARLYYGLLGRAPDASGLSSLTAKAQSGNGLAQVASLILGSDEYGAKHAGESDAAFVSDLYAGALGRSASADPGSAYFTDQLAHGASRSVVALEIAESNEAQVHLLAQIEHGYHLV